MYFNFSMPPNEMALYPNWLILYVLRVVIPMLMLVLSYLCLCWFFHTYAYVGSCGIQNSNQKWQRPSKSIWYWLLSIYYDCGWTVPKKAKKIIYNFNENDWTELYPEMFMLMFMKILKIKNRRIICGCYVEFGQASLLKKLSKSRCIGRPE